jgi:hypothetical protein
MRTIKFWALAVLVASACFGQDQNKTAAPSEPVKFYRLDFTVKELEGGKVINSRAYSMSASTDNSSGVSSVRTGNKVPVKMSQGVSYQMVDVGVNIDCRRVKAEGDALSFDATAEVSSVAPSEVSESGPIIRQNRWTAAVLIPLKKTTIIFSSDDPSSKRQVQLEVTASPINH